MRICDEHAKNSEMLSEQMSSDLDAILRKRLKGIQRLASVEACISELSTSQKQLLLRKLLGTDTSEKTARDRIPKNTRARPIQTIPDEIPATELERKLRESLSKVENQKLANLAERLDSLSYEQKRSLLHRLVDLVDDGSRIARLSYAQQRCWFMELLAPGTGTQNIAAAVRARGPLDIALLERCLNIVIERHEVLRTNIINSPDGPRQLIMPSKPLRITGQSLEHLHRDGQENEIAEILLGHAYTPFNFTTEGLIRVASFSLAPDDRILLLTMHHIISDEWSVGLLLEELGFLYASAADRAGLPELPIQYADYAEWQSSVMTPHSLERDLEYWREQLSGAPFCLEIPSDRPRPRLQTTNGRMQGLLLGQDVGTRMASLAENEQSTFFMAMFTAFIVLLRARTGREDIIVGTDFANRNRVEVSKLIGFFVNELALRTDLSGDPSFRDLLRRVRHTCLGAFNHQELPFQWLVEDLKPLRDPSRTPIFQVVFDLLNIPMQLQFQGVTFEPMRLPLRPAKYDLTLFISQSPKELHALLEYNTDLYNTSTAEQLLTDYQTILGIAVSDPDSRLSRFVAALEFRGQAKRS